MALKAKIDKDTHAGLPDAIKAEYKPGTEADTFILDAEGVEDVSGLKSALGKERANLGKATKFLKKLGITKVDDETAYSTLEEALGEDTLEEALARAKGAAATATEADAAVKEARKLKGKVEEATETIQTQTAFIDSLVRENQLKDVIGDPKWGGNPLFLMPHLLKHTKTFLEDGEDGKKVYVARVIDPKNPNEPRLKGSKEMTLDDLVGEFFSKPEFADAFAGTGVSGSGAKPSAPASGDSGSRKVTNDAVSAKKRSGAYSGI